MNSIYQSIWNEKTGTFVAVSENTKRGGKKTSSCSTAAGTGVRFALQAMAACVLLSFGAQAWSAPVGGAVSAGSASIDSGAGVTTITQSTQNVAINWQSFNIAQAETVRFVQPGSTSVALNRVLGSDPSSILGNLQANGKVFLINPNGILFGKTASVNVGGLVASTMNITDADFMAGNYKFTDAGNGTIVNEGAITAADRGFVALLGAEVRNDGVITARLGSVVLAAGQAATLDVAGDGLLNVTIDQGALNALISNGGMIQADGGQVLLTAQAAGQLLNTMVSNTGVIQAQTVENHNGVIKLLGDMQKGTVIAGGTLDASAPSGGNGGFIETSAARVNVLDSARITTAAATGETGTWLIDPVDYTIAAVGGDITGAQLSANLGTNNVIIMSTSGALGVDGNVNVADIVTWSANKLTLNAQNNINISQAMTGTGTASLALLYGQATVAVGNTSTYNVLAPVSLPSGNNFSTLLGSNGVATNYTVINSLGASGSMTGTDLQGMNGNLAGHYALGSNIDASATSGWNTGFGFDPVGQIATPFSGNFDGLGHTINSLTINRPLADNVGLFGYVVSTGGAMLKNVTIAGGSVQGGLYVGNLVGHITGDITNTHTAQAVTGNGTPDTYVGGIAGWSTGNISNSSATGAVTGAGSYVGGIVGWITGNITCCFATGAVTGSGLYVGGLAGWVTGDVSRSYATGTVNTTAANVGGLIGWITGNISNSYALGDVATAGNNVGGLVGYKKGAVSNSYSAGFVAGGAPVGGLIGLDDGGTVSNSFWDTTASGQLLSAGGAGVKGMTTLEMKQQGNFTGGTTANSPLTPAWDFTNIWTMPQDGTSYPSLQACLVAAPWTSAGIVPPDVTPDLTPDVSSVVSPVVPPVVTPIETLPIATLPLIFQSADSLMPAAFTFVPAETPPSQSSLASTVVDQAPLEQPAQSLLVDQAPAEQPAAAAVPEQPAVAPPAQAPVRYVAPIFPRKQDRN